MYSAVLKLITPKRAVIAATILAVFAAGWMTNGWRYKTKMAKQQSALLIEYEKQREQYMLRYQEQQQIDQAAAEELSADLAAIRAQRRVLEDRLRSAALVKSDDEICNGGGNPFGPDFARMWNDAATSE